MNYMSVGDLARTYQLRHHNTQIKSALTDLTNELTTGVRNDTGSAVNGDFRALSSIDASLARLETYSQTGAKADLILTSMQASLDHIRTTAADAAQSLLSSTSDTTSTGLAAGLSQAKAALTNVLSTLNSTVAGRHVFSGTAVDTPAVGSAETLMAALTAATSGLSLAGDIDTAVSDWFDAPAGTGGYLDTFFGGDETGISGLQISDDTSLTLPITAADRTIRDVLKGLALAALASDAAVSLSDGQRQELSALSAKTLLASDGGLIETQAALGVLETQVESAGTRNTAEKTILSTARLDLIGVDSYETATALQAAQTQLETLYTLTARLSALSLANYL